MSLRKILLYLFIYSTLFSSTAVANPYFYIVGSSVLDNREDYFELHVNTTGDQIGALQAVVNFPSDILSAVRVSTADSVCRMWAPANSVPPGKDLLSTTPYFHGNKVVFSCGFTGSGYRGSDGLIGTFTVQPYENGAGSIFISDSYFAFLGNRLTPGAMDVFPILVSIPDPNAATPSATPTPSASASATPSVFINTTVLFSDVKVVDLTKSFENTAGRSGSSGGGGSSSGSGLSGQSSIGIQSDAELTEVTPDNTVPSPPSNITPRPNATPRGTPASVDFQEPMSIGEVMSAQNLRDLLIPGKSKADKTVVLINFITTLTFLLLLTFLIWKLIMNNRSTKLKSQYIQELISGELSALEGKMAIVKDKPGQEKFEAELSKTVNDILQNVSQTNSPKKPSSTSPPEKP